MGNELNRKQILDLFEDQLFISYEDYCKKHELPPDYKGLITYIIDQELIHPSVIQKYTVLKEFNARCLGDRGQKTQTVEALADRFNLSSRTIWSILKSHVKKWSGLTGDLVKTDNKLRGAFGLFYHVAISICGLSARGALIWKG